MSKQEEAHLLSVHHALSVSRLGPDHSFASKVTTMKSFSSHHSTLTFKRHAVPPPRRRAPAEDWTQAFASALRSQGSPAVEADRLTFALAEVRLLQMLRDDDPASVSIQSVKSNEQR
jgi:hypothetical protein